MIQLNKTRIALISSHNNTFLTNSNLLSQTNLEFIFVGCDQDDLAQCSFISEKVIYKSHENCNGSMDVFIKNTDLIENLPEIVLFEVDDAMYQIWNSDLSESTKLNLLPIKNPRFMNMAGSKVGQIETFKTLGIRHPHSQIFTNDSCKPEIAYPFMAKGDRWAGGVFVRVINNYQEFVTWRESHEPKFLIQEIIHGQEYSVDAVFRKGQLTYCAISNMHDLLRGNGPAARRTYQKDIPQEVLNMFRKVGLVCQIDGFVNGTVFQEFTTGNWLLFEFDCRINIWFHVSQKLGFSLDKNFEYMKGEKVLLNDSLSRNIEVIDVRRYKEFLRIRENSDSIAFYKYWRSLLKNKLNGGVLFESIPKSSHRIIKKLFNIS